MRTAMGAIGGDGEGGSGGLMRIAMGAIGGGWWWSAMHTAMGVVVVGVGVGVVECDAHRGVGLMVFDELEESGRVDWDSVLKHDARTVVGRPQLVELVLDVLVEAGDDAGAGLVRHVADLQTT